MGARTCGGRWGLALAALALGCGARPPLVLGETRNDAGQADAAAREGHADAAARDAEADRGRDLGVDAAVAMGSVYAHSPSELYRLDPATLTAKRVGFFTFTGPGITDGPVNDMTDLALDRAGRLVGVASRGVLAVDPTNARCVFLASLPPGYFNALAWVATGQGPERLLAISDAGDVIEIKPATGSHAPVGSLGPGLSVSGDLVSAGALGILAVLRGPDSDQLARVDPDTGAASIIGPIGFTQVWGVALVDGRIVGLSADGSLIRIDAGTGLGTLHSRQPVAFWGAASAPP